MALRHNQHHIRHVRDYGRVEFPAAADIPALASADAQAALDALHRLAAADLVTVYTAAGSHGTRWQVWSELQRRRFTLSEWAVQWIAHRDAYDGEMADDGKEGA